MSFADDARTEDIIKYHYIFMCETYFIGYFATVYLIYKSWNYQVYLSILHLKCVWGLLVSFDSIYISFLVMQLSQNASSHIYQLLFYYNL